MPVWWATGPALEVLAKVPDGSIDLFCTSPPFWRLRSYLPDDHPDKANELGQEGTPGEFIDNLLRNVAEWRRCLAPHGSIVIEIGDTSAGSGGAGGDYNDDGLREGQPKFTGSGRARTAEESRKGTDARNRGNTSTGTAGLSKAQAWGMDPAIEPGGRGKVMTAKGNRGPGLPLDKSLCLIPDVLAFALAYGFNPLTGNESPAGMWRVRNEVVWARTNPVVGRDGDKFRRAHSKVIIATLARDRVWDIEDLRTANPRVAETASSVKSRRTKGGAQSGGDMSGEDTAIHQNPNGAPPLDWEIDLASLIDSMPGARGIAVIRAAVDAGILDLGDVWDVPTRGYSGAHFACVDEGTEALTPKGWKAHSDLRDGDRIAAYDPQEGILRWEAATFHRYPFSGEMVRIDKRETVQLLTPNHRVLVKSRKGFQRVVRADELVPSHRLPVAAPFPDAGTEVSVGGVESAELLGWFVAEGWVKSGKTVMLCQSWSANPKKCERIRGLLTALGADYTECIRWIKGTEILYWSIRGDVAFFLSRLGGDKTVDPSIALALPLDECSALLDGLIGGDGHVRPDGRRSFIQKRLDLIDTVQALCSRLGFRSTITPHRHGGYTLTIGARDWLSLRGTNGVHAPVGREHFEGTVWCPSVPSGFWLARRDGRPFITGNTFTPTLLRKPIVAMTPRRVCSVCGEPSRRIVAAEQVSTGRTTNGPKNIGRKETTPAYDNRTAVAVSTVGWTECDCEGDDRWRRGRVCDPFGGSGTVGMVADANGFDALLIDLNGENTQLARDRIGFMLTEVDRDELADVLG